MAEAKTVELPVREEKPIVGSDVKKPLVQETELKDAGDAKPALDPAELIEPHILHRLDPDFLAFFLDATAKNPPAVDVSIEEERAHPERFRSPAAIDTSGYERVADYEVTSEDGEKFVVRAYHPDPKQHGEGPYGVHLNFHGGGFVRGDLWTEAQMCLNMREAGVVVIDVNYRHCPETVWGKCMQDAWAALTWARDSASTLNINPNSVSIGGVSAGGHISLVLQHMARDAGVPLRLCLATVPSATDAMTYRFYTDSPYDSFREFYRGPVLPWARIHFFARYCFPDAAAVAAGRARWPDFWFAPIRAPNFAGLCDAFIRTAELDPLRDEGEAYGMKLVAAGNKVTLKRYMGAPHTFVYFPFMKQKQTYDADAIAALREAHGLH